MITCYAITKRRPWPARAGRGLAPRGRQGRVGSRCGLSLIDMMMTLAVLGIVLAAIIPSMAPEEHLRLTSAATVLAADLEYAQSATLAEPSDPTVLVFDQVDGGRYWLAHKSAPTVPIPMPGDPNDLYEMVFGAGRGAQLAGITISSGPLSGMVEFDSFGRLESGADAELILANLSGQIKVRVRALTGSVFIEDVD